MTGRRLSYPSERAEAKKLKIGDNTRESPIQKGVKTCAKWCEIQQDGTCVLDEAKIKSMLSQTECQDLDWMRDMIQGRVLNARVYPLIFTTTEPDAPEVARFRTLSYFTRLLDDADVDSVYYSLSPEQQRIVTVGVRDLYIAESMGLLSVSEKHTLRGMVEMIDESLDERHFSEMRLSSHPSRDFTIIKFIENLDDKIGPEESELYAQLMNIPKLFAVFVRPADLSYHNFENIVPLDAWLESKLSQHSASEINVALTTAMQIQPRREVFTCRLQGAAQGLLKDLSGLDLYVSPLNKSTRGGERFIFHSTLLSKALTRALKSSDLLDKLGDGGLRSSFEFVNYVFRCNRFNTDDSHFQSHLDTPYYDSARSQVSKYTLLINLTGGCNNPVLRIEDVSLSEVQEFTCVIFDQRYEHEGWPFLDGQKVFIRTELVFKDEHLGHNETIAGLFSEACYMTGQSMFDQELSSYANECFERANSLHWAVEKAASQAPVYLLKHFQGIRFLTNGYNYWFLKSDESDVKEYALVAVLDYFNCKVGQHPFRSLTTSTKVQKQFDSVDEIWLAFISQAHQAPTSLRSIKESDLDSVIKKGPTKPLEWRFEDWDGEMEGLEDFEEDGDGCCPLHSFPMFNPWKNSDVMAAYDLCSSYTLKKLFGAPMIMLDEKITINKANIEVVGDKIYFLGERNGASLPRVNFAACWAGEEIPSEFVVVGNEIPAPAFLIPPLTLHECSQGYQLRLDFFRNDWMVEINDGHTIPVPDLTERPENETSFESRVTELVDDLESLFRG